MKSTTGKLIRFTLQRTPTWAWAGLDIKPMALVPYRIYGPSPVEQIWRTMLYRERILEIMGVPKEFLEQKNSNRSSAIILPVTLK